MFRKNKINSPTTSPPRSGGGASSVATPATNASNNTNTSTSSAVNSRSPIVNNILRYANNNKFNPRLIFSQIIAIQSIHYLILSMLFQLNSILYGSPVTIDRIFTAKHLNLWTSEGRLDAGTVVLSGVLG